MRAYRGRFFVRKRVWVCGDYIEADIYPVFQAPGQRRKKSKPTREVQERINQRDAERKFNRIAHSNFGDGDLTADLTVREPMEPEAAMALLKAYLRRLRRRYRKSGTELKYMYVAERGTISGQVHFHMLLNQGPMSRDEVEEAWGLGIANCRRLQFDEHGITALTQYLSKGRRGGKRKRPARVTYRRWTCSMNLQKPEPEITDGEIAVPEVEDIADAIERRSADNLAERMWPGFALAEAEVMRNLINHGTYIHMRMARPETWRGRPPRADYLSGEIGGEEYA